MTKVAFNSHALDNLSSADVCRLVNLDLCAGLADSDYYCTAFYAILNLTTLEITYSCCGHPKAVIWKEEKKSIEYYKTRGFNIGSADIATYKEDRDQLSKGDKLYIFSDGIVEAENPAGDLYDYARLDPFIERHNDLPVDDVVRLLIEDVYAFQATAGRTDDISLIVLEVLEEPEGYHKVEIVREVDKPKKKKTRKKPSKTA